MDQRLLLYSVGVWVLLVFVAIMNGVLREEVLLPALGDHGGHVLSSIILSLIIFLVTCVFLRHTSFVFTTWDLLLIGTLWLTLTVSFEFLFGHYVMGHPWENLIADYNIFEGKVWVLVLISTFLSPTIAGKLLIEA